MNRELHPEVCRACCIFVYYRGAPCVCTHYYHSRKKQVLAVHPICWLPCFFLWGHKPYISKQNQLVDLLFFSSWVNSTYNPGWFSSVSYSWFAFEGIMIIDYCHLIIYLLCKFVLKFQRVFFGLNVKF